MTPKDPPKPGRPKSELLDDLTSLKSTLDEDDDNVPLLLDDEDIPLLGGDDDDIPVLDTVDTRAQQAADKSSLEAALKQLESMELAPRSRKAGGPAAPEPQSLEEKIRANAAPPIIKQEELTRVRENPFLNTSQKAQLELNRKLREEAKKMAEIAALSKPRSSAAAPPPAPKPPVEESVIDFTDNPFLKASAAPASAPLSGAAAADKVIEDEEEDGSAEILKELEEDLPLSMTRAGDSADSGLGDLILDDEIPEAPATPNKSAAPNADALIDEVIEEYMVILETALRKKLKEKLPDLLKK